MYKRRLVILLIAYFLNALRNAINLVLVSAECPTPCPGSSYRVLAGSSVALLNSLNEMLAHTLQFLVLVLNGKQFRLLVSQNYLLLNKLFQLAYNRSTTKCDETYINGIKLKNGYFRCETIKPLTDISPHKNLLTYQCLKPINISVFLEKSDFSVKHD